MSSNAMRMTAKIALHLLIACIVVIAPPVIYNVVTMSSWSSIQGMEFVGAITYPIYFLYWIAKLKSSRAKFLLSYLVGFLVAAAMVMGLSDRATPFVILLIPALLGALPLVLALIGIARNRRFAITCLWTALLVLPLGCVISLLVVYGSAMSSVGNMRY